MRHAHWMTSGLPLAALALLVSACGTSSAGQAGAKPTATMGGMSGGMNGGMSHKGKPNMNEPTKQVAPAVTAMLMPKGMACGHMVKGHGTVKMIPVHVGKVMGPHVNLTISLRSAISGEKLTIGGTFSGMHSWSGTVETEKVDMMGELHAMTRLMPMLRAGRYSAQIMLRDASCSGGMSLAYETPKTPITLK